MFLDSSNAQCSISTSTVLWPSRLPNLIPPNITCCPFLQEGPHFLEFASTSTGVVKQIAELARIGLHILDVLLVLGVTLEDEKLVFGEERLLHGLHCIAWEGRDDVC